MIAANTHVVKTVEEVKQAVRAAKRQATVGNKIATVGFVPTMGYLHEGHASLIRKAREECAVVVLSIFVNPIQFGPNEDFGRYPRDPDKDLALASANGADIVFMPEVEEMYPQPIKTKVSVSGGITDKLCGASRPGHFDGVATVVSKFFHIVEPDRAYFGMKDAQQVAVIEQMVRDLNFNVTIVRCPIVRESDGLALSSRNIYLSQDERKQALVLSQSLQKAEEWMQELGSDFTALKKRVAAHIQTSPLADIDYVEIVTYPDMQRLDDTLVKTENGPVSVLIALAVKFGSTRLIDNRLFSGIRL